MKTSLILLLLSAASTVAKLARNNGNVTTVTSNSRLFRGSLTNVQNHGNGTLVKDSQEQRQLVIPIGEVLDQIGLDACPAYKPPNELGQRLADQQHICDDSPLFECEFIGTHNSYSSYRGESGGDYGVARNQCASQTQQLEDGGFRILNWDIYKDGDTFRLCHGVCSWTDTTLTDAITAVSTWLNSNTDEFIILNIEDKLSNDVDRDEAATDLRNGFGSKLFRPKEDYGGLCRFPLNDPTVTKRKLLNRQTPKQIMLYTASMHGTCSGPTHYRNVVFDMQGGPLLESCKDELYCAWKWCTCACKRRVCETVIADRAGDNAIRNYNSAGHGNNIPTGFWDPHRPYLTYEDRLPNSNDHINNNEEARKIVRWGASHIGIDYGLNVIRHEGFVWSWRKGYPKKESNKCAYQTHSSTDAYAGRWKTGSCARIYPFACQHKTNGEWRISSRVGDFSKGKATCSNDFGSAWRFGLPVNGNYNWQLYNQRGSFTDRIWVNYKYDTAQGRYRKF